VPTCQTPRTWFSSFGNVADPGVWSQVHDEGVQILENLLNIRGPVIAAVEGRLDVHSEYALLANVIVAGEGATFDDDAGDAEGLVISSLSNKTALVTGASRGIGRATALVLASRGAYVLVHYRNGLPSQLSDCAG
jgi:hypothetical protein